MPLYIVHDIQPGEVVHLSTNAPCLAPYQQASEAFAEDPDKAGGVTMMEDGVLAPLQDSKPIESAFVAKTANAEALQPHMLIEAKHSPNKPLSALPPLIDPAPTSTMKCTTTYNMPYHRAINIST
jgi:hypothetical protein